MPITSVVVVTGYLGSGKTSVLAHLAGSGGPVTDPAPGLARRPGLLAAAMDEAPGGGSAPHVSGTPDITNASSCAALRGRPVAIVNELGPINPDAVALADLGVPVIDLAGGAIETNLRERFMAVLARLAADAAPTRVLVEASGVATPGELLWAVGEALGPRTPVALVTVADASSFLDDRLHASGSAGCGTGRATIADLLRAQVEQASVVVLNKLDLAPASDTDELASLVARTNPHASVVRTTHGRVDPSVIRLHAPPATPTVGIEANVSSMVFAARRPLHPARTHALLSGGAIAAARSKGLCWLASQDSRAAWWSQTGAVASVTPGPAWWAATEPARWPSDEQTWARIYATWAAPFGDRRQELLFAGPALDAEYHRLLLHGCLLSDEELTLGVPGDGCAALTHVRAAA